MFCKRVCPEFGFFQQQNKPVFPFVEGRLEQLTSYMEGNRKAQNFGSDLALLITQHRFNPNNFYPTF